MAADDQISLVEPYEIVPSFLFVLLVLFLSHILLRVFMVVPRKEYCGMN